MDKIWIVTNDQLANVKTVAKTVYERDFKKRGISEDNIAETDSLREEFVSKCYDEMGIQTLSDNLLHALINMRKANKQGQS